jgi:hypothetical protein
MATRWICRLGDRDVGPVTFQDMVKMVRAGELYEENEVRRESGGDWIPASEVYGLFRMARKPPSEDGLVEGRGPGRPGGTGAKPKRPEPAAAEPGASPARWVLLGCLAILAVAVAAWQWWPRLGSPKASGSARSTGGPAPKEVALPLRTTRPVPGLEGLDPAITPSLSHDLKTIVFAMMPSVGAGFDLYMASREDVGQRFGGLAPVASCNSADSELYPALSPDGRELFFQRSEQYPQLYYATRATATDPFGDPVAWTVPDPSADQQRAERPQFLDPLRLAFRTFQPASRTWAWWIAERAAPGQPFRSVRPLAIRDGRPAWFFTASELRAYCGTPEGLLLSARSATSEPFATVSPVLDAGVTGPLDTESPVWLTPREDVMFFVSPGPGRRAVGPASGRRLWMIRLKE